MQENSNFIYFINGNNNNNNNNKIWNLNIQHFKLYIQHNEI